MVRSRALTMPYVTVLTRANGEPNASTGSPTAIWSELPNSTGGTLGLATLSTAMSDSGSRPTRVAADVVPSLNATERVVAAPPAPWALVITYPSGETTKPEPMAPVTRTVTTLGVTRLATPAKDSGARWAAAGGGVWVCARR